MGHLRGLAYLSALLFLTLSLSSPAVSNPNEKLPLPTSRYQGDIGHRKFSSLRASLANPRQRVLQEGQDQVPVADPQPMVHSVGVQEYDVSQDNQQDPQPESQQDTQPDNQQANQQRQGPDPAVAGADRVDDFSTVSSTNQDVWRQFQTSLPDVEAEGSQVADATSEEGDAVSAVEDASPDVSELDSGLGVPDVLDSSDTSGQGGGDFSWEQEANKEAAAAEAAVAKALGSSYEDPTKKSDLPPEMQKDLTVPFERQKAEEEARQRIESDKAAAEAAAAAAGGEPTSFNITRASAAITGAYFNFTRTLNLTGPLNITEGISKIQAGNVGPEALLTAVLGTLVGMLVCLCCCCVCGMCRRKVDRRQYKPVSTKGDIEM